MVDDLSRSYLHDTVLEDETMSEVVHGITKYIHISDSDKKNFKREIENDLVLSTVNKFHNTGWPKSSCSY